MSIESELGHLSENFKAALNGSLHSNPKDRQRALDEAMSDKPVEGPFRRDMLTGRVFSEVV